jgi:flagellar basal-body rod modification protein FlgD
VKKVIENINMRMLNNIFSGTATKGKEDFFIKLLITQIKTQNPLEPMKTQEFTSQIAQFTSIEQLLTIEKLLRISSLNYQLQNAISLIGKEVSALNSDGSSISGLVKNVLFSEDKIYLTLNTGDKVLLENIFEIK